MPLRITSPDARQLQRLLPGLPLEAARAELDLPDRSLVEALAAQRPRGDAGPIEANGGYLRLADGGETEQQEAAGTARTPAQRPALQGSAAQDARPRLPAAVAEAVQAVLADLAGAPFSAPGAERLAELGLDAKAAAAAERAGLLRRLPGNVLLAPDAPGRAARILADLPQPFTAAQARQALDTTRRVVIPLLEWLDREGITRRLPDDRRTMREPSGSPGPDGGR